MKKYFYLLILSILYTSPALANRIIKCDSVEKVLDCLYSDPQDGKIIGESLNYKLDDSTYLVLIHSKDMSGAYNPYYVIYFYKNKSQELIVSEADDNFIVRPAVDTKSLVLSSLNKGSGSGATGTIKFFTIDPKAEALYLKKTFRTDTKSSGLHYNADNDEMWQEDKPCGYMERANQFIEEQNYDIDNYILSDNCLN